MAAGTVRRVSAMTVGGLLGLLVLTATSGAAGRLGIGKMTVVPTRVIAGSSGNELALTFVADSAALSGQTIVDVPRGWSRPQRTSPSGKGYVELQSGGCASATRITGIAGRRIAIATHCPRRQSYKLLYHRAAAPLLSADGYIFLTQTRPATRPVRGRKRPKFLPLGPRKQPIVRVRGAAPAKLFMTLTNIATVGVQFAVTVRVIDQFGNNAPDYAGTIRLTSTDPAATLPPPYTLGAADTGQHTYTGVILRTTGTQRIVATASNGFTLTSAPITVSPFSS